MVTFSIKKQAERYGDKHRGIMRTIKTNKMGNKQTNIQPVYSSYLEFTNIYTQFSVKQTEKIITQEDEQRNRHTINIQRQACMSHPYPPSFSLSFSE